MNTLLYWTAAMPSTRMAGVEWRVDSETNPINVPLLISAQEVLDDHLRSPSTQFELGYVERLIRTAQEDAQRFTQLAIGEQALVLVADTVPAVGDLILPFPPVTAVTGFTYLDDDGVEQTWGGSPLPYETSLPTGPKPRAGRLRPASGESWPSTSGAMDSVRVAYTAGFTEETVPSLIIQGMLLIVGELYKQRSESVHASNSPALVRARSLWARLKVY